MTKFQHQGMNDPKPALVGSFAGPDALPVHCNLPFAEKNICCLLLVVFIQELIVLILSSG